MKLYQCRGQITATSSDNNNYCVLVKAITQFECKKNRLRKHVADASKFPSGASFEATVFNVFMEVEIPDEVKPPIYQATTELKLFWLTADHPILVPDQLRERFDDFDTDPQYTWTFIIGEVKTKSSSYDYELKYIQFGPEGDDE